MSLAKRYGSLSGFMLAQAISTTGTRVSMVALPWFVLTTTGSAGHTGAVAAAEMVPLVVLQALSGPIVDRVGARRIAVICDAFSVLAVGAIPLLHDAGVLSFPLLLVFAGLAGALRGPSEAAKNSLLPTLSEQTGVPLERVTGLDSAIERIASTAGAAVGAGIVALVGAANALLVDAASFGLCSFIVWFSVREARSSAEADEPYIHSLKAGWNFLRHDPVLLGISLMVAVTNFIDQAFTTVLLPVWAEHSGAGIGAVGLVATTFALAAAGASTLAAAIGHRLPRFWTYLICFALAGAPRYFALALDLPIAWIVVVCVVGGLGAGFINPILGAVLFERTPPSMVGRVNAASHAAGFMLLPFGGLAAGAMVSQLTIAPSLLIFGAAFLITTTAPALQPRWRELDRRSSVAGSVSAEQD